MSITLGIFLCILFLTLGITYWAARRTRTTSEFYAADSRLTAAQMDLRLPAIGVAPRRFWGSPDEFAVRHGRRIMVGAARCLLHRSAPGCRAAEKYRQVHARRRHHAPHAATDGAAGRDRRDDCREFRVPDAANGGGRRAGEASDRNALPSGGGPGRSGHDHLRGIRRDARDHLGADRQGGAHAGCGGGHSDHGIGHDLV